MNPYSDYKLGRFKCKSNAWIKRTTFGVTLLFLFHPLGMEIPAYLHKISIPILLSSCAIIAPLRTFLDQPMRLQV